MINLAVLLAISFALALFVWVSIRVQNFRSIGLFDWALLGLAGVYGIGWAIVLLVTNEGNNPFWERWIPVKTGTILWHTPLAVTLTFAIYTGWLLPGRRHSSNIETRNFESIPSRFVGLQAISSLKVSAWVMLHFAFMAQLIYTAAFGGLLGALEYSANIRSAIFEIHNAWSFLQPFTGLSLIASFVFYGLVLSQKERPWLGLFLSFVFSLYLLYSWLGRIGFLIYLANFYLSFLLIKKKNYLNLLWKTGFAFSSILIGAYYLSAVLSLKYTEGILKFIALELSFPFGSFFGHFSIVDTKYRWFLDLLISPIYLLPSSFWNNIVESVSSVNTTLIAGAPKGVSGVTGGIPVDILTLGYLQASGFGIVIVGLMFGILLRLLEFLLAKIPDIGVRTVLKSYVGIKIAILGLFYSQPEHFVKTNFSLIVAALIITAFSRFSYRFRFNFVRR